MIHHYFTRTSDNKTATCTDRNLSPAQALKYFVDAELMYGSKITNITDGLITTVSSCMGTTDNMTFSGSVQDMAVMVHAAKTYESFRDPNRTIRMHFSGMGMDRHFQADAEKFITESELGMGMCSKTIVSMLAEKGASAEKCVKNIRYSKAAFELIYIDQQNVAEVLELYELGVEETTQA